MTRLALLFRNPQLLLPAVPAVLAAVAVTVGSGASFTSNTANPSNTFSAGNLTHVNSKDNAAILTASNLIPGGSQTGTVTITNNGNVAGTFSLTQSNVTDSAGPNGGLLSGKLDLQVQDITDAASPVTVFTGKLNAMSSQNLGSFAAGEARTYRFTVAFPDGGVPSSATAGDNAFKLSSASAQFNWQGISS